jgi:hypothetical protein
VRAPWPYQISYDSLVPKEGQCANLLVPVAVSSSHIAYGSIRMEPVFMILGQSAATAAVQAIDGDLPVQRVDYDGLRDRLLADGQVLELPRTSRAGSARAVPIDRLKGLVVDDGKATYAGDWLGSAAQGTFVGHGYRHDGGTKDGKKAARFQAQLPEAGRYEVRLAYAAYSNRASNVPVQIHHAGGVSTQQINQKKPGPIEGGLISLGTYNFLADQPAVVELSNAGVDGYVIADAVQFIRASPQ